MPSEQETGLLLPVGNPGAKVIALLRKLTSLSIAEIRQRATEGRPITGFNDQDKYGIRDDEVLLHSVRDAHEGLLALGINAHVVMDGREEDTGYLDNVIQSMQETAGQLEWEDEVALVQEEVKRAITELQEEYEDFCWWMPDDLYELSEELRREVPAGHPLEGRELVALARSERRDDVLFHDGQDYTLVHLTWSAHNILPFPMFQVVESEIAKFLQNDYLEGAAD